MEVAANSPKTKRLQKKINSPVNIALEFVPYINKTLFRAKSCIYKQKIPKITLFE